MTAGKGAHVIVVGNEKGGTGKSTTSMHLIVALLKLGRSVASIDLDVRQGTLTRYMDNRRAFAAAPGRRLPMPVHVVIQARTDAPSGAARAEEDRLSSLIEQLAPLHDVIVIDTPGNDAGLTRLGHSYADTLITPLNDSFMDLDVLARVDGDSMRIIGPSQYAEMVWKQKMTRAQRDNGFIDWIVMRNRLSSLDARNKRRMARILRELSTRLGFRLVPGFGERVVFRELFLRGLTMMDLRDVAGPDALTLSQIAARQEVRTLVEGIRFASLARGSATG
ncbi:MAG: AAA family ATPase [Alphaproteobacteria bacterium]|nr:AAA family ATPase [Alphaproteobacteria bacterium]